MIWSVYLEGKRTPLYFVFTLYSISLLFLLFVLLRSMITHCCVSTKGPVFNIAYFVTLGPPALKLVSSLVIPILSSSSIIISYNDYY